MSSAMPIHPLLEDAERLKAELLPCLDFQVSEDDLRSTSSHALARIAFEHGSSALALVEDGKYTSAAGLLRLQYEALLRSIWLAYCASETAMARLASDELPKPNDRISSVSEMLSSLAAGAPSSLVEPLVEFRDSSWKPLSSLVHGGPHAVRWVRNGFPEELIAELVRVCDGMLVLTCVHLAKLSGNPAHGGHVMSCVERHRDCLPPLREVAEE